MKPGSLVVASLLALIQPARADDPAPTVETQKVPAPAAVFVISGGVTMGAYEGGQTYIFTEFLKSVGHYRRACAQPDNGVPDEVCAYVAAFPRDVAFVGSSAGSINALIATTALLTEEDAVELPEASTFFRAWIPQGARKDGNSIDYFPARSEEEGRVLYSRARVEALLDQLGEREVLPQEQRAWDGELSLGITTTRMVSQHGDLGERATNLSFGFRAADDGGYGLAGAPFRSLVLAPTEGDTDPRPDVYGNAVGQVNDPLGWVLRDQGVVPALARAQPSRRAGYDPGVFDLIRSSSSLPGAFEVEAFNDCWVRQHALFAAGRGTDRESDLDDACAHEPAVPMLDGGVFDNNPIQLGQALALPIGGRLLDQEAPPAGKNWSKPTFYFLDPHRVGVDEVRTESTFEFDRLTRFVSTMVPAARVQELTAWAQKNPDADVRVVLPRLLLNDTYSRYFGAFLGIFDRSFRVWDFYVGMRDALDFLRGPHGRVAVYEAQGGVNLRRVFLDVPIPEALLPQAPEGSPSDAVRALLESASAPVDHCGDDNINPFCVALRGLSVRTQDLWLATYDSSLAVLPRDFLDTVRLCEPRELPRGTPPDTGSGARYYDPRCAAYDPYALAGNLRHLAWIAMERRVSPEGSDELNWLVERLSDKRGSRSNGWFSPRDTSIFTAWDLGERYKGTDKPMDRRKARREWRKGHGEGRAPDSRAYDAQVALDGYRWTANPEPPDVRWFQVPQFGMRARNRLDWQLAAITGRGAGSQGLLDESEHPPGLASRIVTAYAHRVTTGRGSMAQVQYLSADRVSAPNATGLGLTFYSTRGSDLLRSFYAGVDGVIQIRSNVDFLLTTHLGLALLHGRMETKMFGSDHAAISPEIGVYARPLAPLDATNACIQTQAGTLPILVGCGVEYRFNLLGLLSVGGQIPITPFAEDQTLATRLNQHRFVLTLTIPVLGAFFDGPDQPRSQKL